MAETVCLEVDSQPHAVMGVDTKGVDLVLTPDKCTLPLARVQAIHDGLPAHLQEGLRARLADVTFVGVNGDTGCMGLEFLKAMDHRDHPGLFHAVLDRIAHLPQEIRQAARHVADGVQGTMITEA